MMRERAARHGLALALDVDAASAVVEADELRFKQVVLNLLSNAVKFTPDGGTGRRRERGSTDTMSAITVTDTGVGVAPEDRERIFESFQQGARLSHAGGHRPRSHAVPAHRRTDGWSDVAGERGGRRQHVRFHGPLGRRDFRTVARRRHTKDRAARRSSSSRTTVNPSTC